MGSTQGQPVPIEWVQSAIDRLIRERELEISPQSVGYRSAFVGAVLLTLPGVEGATNPRRVRLVDIPAVPSPLERAPQAPRRPSPPAGAVSAALHALDASSQMVELARHGELPDIDRSGLYSWWVDERGALELSEGLGLPLPAGRVYVGQAGATLWPSGKKQEATLRDRISLMHLGTRISFSTLRLTFTACLRSKLSLRVVGAKILAPESEANLTEWMKRHLQIAIHAYDDGDTLDEVEQEVLQVLNPPLNLKHMNTSDIRVRLRQLRDARFNCVAN